MYTEQKVLNFWNKSFYFMKTDSLDRFGTKLEKRFTKKEMEQMLLNGKIKAETLVIWSVVLQTMYNELATVLVAIWDTLKQVVCVNS